jgi:sulfonate transport system ATP-binding protein
MASSMLPTQIELQGLAFAGDVASDAAGDVAVPAAAPAQRRSLPAGIALQADGLSKRFGEREVLGAIDLRIEPGEFVAIVGRSGCGKSTLLRLIAGLEHASGGRLTLDGGPLAQSKRDLRFMFQDARLLPWKRVIDNIALGLDAADARERALEALAQVGLADRANEWPAVLSGGQRQRVALARALVHAPRLLLLDEPLGALDALTRIEMQSLIESLWKRHGFTALLVTHDVSEAVALADRVLLIEDHQVALDERIALPRPRSRGNAAFAALEERVLQRVLQTPGSEAPETLPPITDWRFSV